MVTDKEKRKTEDEYFARQEFERRKKLLEEQHANLKEAEKKELKDLHWMRCPKCGMEMLEIDFEGVRVDKCSTCLGIYLDDGEVQQLLRGSSPGFLKRLTSVFMD